MIANDELAPYSDEISASPATGALLSGPARRDIPEVAPESGRYPSFASDSPHTMRARPRHGWLGRLVSAHGGHPVYRHPAGSATVPPPSLSVEEHAECPTVRTVRTGNGPAPQIGYIVSTDCLITTGLAGTRRTTSLLLAFSPAVVRCMKRRLWLIEGRIYNFPSLRVGLLPDGTLNDLPHTVNTCC